MIGGLGVGVIIYLLTKKSNFKTTNIVIMGISLGDKVAINLGEKINFLRVGLLSIGIILTASSVSVSGTIFLGLIASHILYEKRENIFSG